LKLGFNLLLWTTHVTDEHWPIIERLKATGYDGVEIPMVEGEPEHYARLGLACATQDSAQPDRRHGAAQVRQEDSG